MASYCHSRFRARRRTTRVVRVGDVPVGGDHPLAVQSMTTTPTQDIDATVAQTIRLAEAGCEIVRITAQNVAAARALKDIRRQLRADRVAVPLVADIHFLPAAAMEAVEHVDKVRINPGNYADKKKFAVREYSDGDYAEELERLHEAFSPIVLRCRDLGRSMRIGTNHGSLSDRIMNRYGDTPLGMVESALEFIRIAESHGFRDIILSMKASNPKVMIEAYRLVVARMAEEGMDYPLHLGVTEAGDGDDARIKSAIGIGSLLADGLGDTIRVSLTEDPVAEIPVARALAEKALGLWRRDDGDSAAGMAEEIDPFDFRRRDVDPVELGPGCVVGAAEPPAVIIPARRPVTERREILLDIARVHARMRDARIEGLLVRVDSEEAAAALPGLIESASPTVRFFVVDSGEADPGMLAQWLRPVDARNLMLLLQWRPDMGWSVLREVAAARGWTVALDVDPCGNRFPAAGESHPGHLLFTTTAPAGDGMHPLGRYRLLAARLDAAGWRAPIWIRNHAATAIDPQGYFGDSLLEASILSGSLLCDGIGDLISVETVEAGAQATGLAYNILQGARARTTKTEYVACPSCGRTLFDLQTTTQKIRQQTDHLKGVTIAVMGCIVNGPGEMADADFGYVGGAPGKINLYVGRTPVKFNVPQEEAVDRLIELIREEGKWNDPPLEA